MQHAHAHHECDVKSCADSFVQPHERASAAPDGQCAMSGSAEASPRSSPPEKDYHSLYVQARASQERTVYELRQRELELAGEPKWRFWKK